MENNILKEVKERLDIYENNKKVILEIEMGVRVTKKNLNREQQEFEEEFSDDKPNNPTYMERKNAKKQVVDARLKQFDKENNFLEAKKSEMEKEFQLGKQSILKNVQDNRELLMKQYELMKDPQRVTEMRQNIEDLNTQKGQILNEIEAIKKEILHKQVTIKYFNSEYLEGQVESLNKKVADINNKINTQIEANNELNIENLGKINFEEEFNKLDDIEEILKKPYISEYTAKGLKEVYSKYEKNKENEKDADDEEKIEEKDKKDKQEDKTDEIIEENDKQQENKVVNPVKTNKDEQETGERKLHDLKFNNTDNGYYNKQRAIIDNIESISMKISESGLPIYTIEKKDGKESEKVYITNIKEYKKVLNDIAKKAGITKKESKKLDPFLIDIISKNGIDDTTSIQKILNKDISIKYDMKNLKKLPFTSKNNFRKIARGAQNNGVEVENFKDVWYRELAKKIKNVPRMLKGKEEPKQLNEANNDTKNLKNKTALRDRANKLKTKAICGYMTFDNKIGEKFTDVSGKLSNIISERKDKRMIKSAEKAQARADKKYDKVYKRIASQNEDNIKYDKLGNRTTKTAEEEKRDEKVKKESAEILKNVHAQQAKGFSK